MKGYLLAAAVLVPIVLSGCAGESGVQDAVDDVDAMADAGDVPGDENAVGPDIDERVDSSSDVCVPFCPAWAECGDDGCGGSCGTCWWEEWCEEMHCVHVDPPPECDGIECGYNEDGYLCGECDEGMECIDGHCGFVDYPDCTNRECGDDGVGGSCGQCDKGFICNLWGECEPTCEYPQDLPAGWGIVSVVDFLTIPDTTEEKAGCFDYTDDGVPDNHLSGLAYQFQKVLDEMGTWTTSMAMEFRPVKAIIADPGITIDGMRVRHDDAGQPGTFLADPVSWNPDNCRPFIRFDDVDVEEGDMSAGTQEMTVHINVSPSFMLPIRLIDVHMSGILQPMGEGIEVTEGVISAVAMGSDLSQAIDLLWAECDKEPPPEDLVDTCQALEMSMAPQPRIVGPGFLLQLHRTVDGTYLDRDSEHPGNAMAMCMKFSAKPGTITGYFTP
ncbi:MAG TPA: hypothetical protein PLC24_10080 [Myxococcota bacterium]|nr:hypothetical protein [Myxococcota bacterium]HPV04896.1 hypothetical protein [Myxococcota bacterium]